MAGMFGEQQLFFFEDTVVPNADVIFRTFHICHQDDQASFVAMKSYLQKELARLSAKWASQDGAVEGVARDAFFYALKQVKASGKKVSDSLSFENRVYLFASEILGLNPEEIAKDAEVAAADVVMSLKDAIRKMANPPQGEGDFLLDHLSEYRRDQFLNKNTEERYLKLAETEGVQAWLAQVQEAIGEFQVRSNLPGLSAEQLAELQSALETSDVVHSREMQRIESISRWEQASFFRNVGIIGAVALLVVGVLVYAFFPQQKKDFAVLDVLVSESRAAVGSLENRMDFPANSLEELNDFVLSAKGLGFEVQPIRSIGSACNPSGASILDYDSVRVLTVQFDCDGEPRFYYELAGSLASLPASTPFGIGTRQFYPYVSDDFNVAVWVRSEKSIALLMGSASSKVLAEFANQL